LTQYVSQWYDKSEIKERRWNEWIKKDFKKGQIVYLKYVGDRRNGTLGNIVEAEVKSIGTKYITTINGDWSTERKFDISNEFIQIHNSGCTDYQLYLSRHHIEEEKEKESIGKLIRSKFIREYCNETTLSIEQLREIREIILRSDVKW